MTDSYDFSKGKLGRITKAEAESAGEVKIFMARTDKSGGAVCYQTLINKALRRSMEAPSIEAMFRRVIREELKRKPDAA